MSYSTKNDLKKLQGKSVLFLDLETTGLPKTKSFGVPPEYRYYNYTKNEFYDGSRIVQIAWQFFMDFDKKYNICIDNIRSKIRRPEGFCISSVSSGIHGISEETAKKVGHSLETLMMDKPKKFGFALKHCDYIIAYNPFFDVSIVLNELNRLKKYDMIKNVKNVIRNRRVLCLGEIVSKEYTFDDWKKRNKYSIPRQTYVYKKFFNEELDNAHNAKYDVYALQRIYKKLSVLVKD